MPASPIRLCLAVVALLLTFPAVADEAAAIQGLISKFPELRADQVGPSPVPGLYEIRLGTSVAYVSADGRYLVQGSILDLETDVNLTEARRDGVRRDVLAGIAESDMIVFAPAKYQDTITVFTDIDCGYCRRLHRQMSDYNKRGIRVRYLFFPRSGPGTESWTKAEQVWCAKDRRAAMTRSKLGAVLDNEACQPNPVAQHYNLGRDFGIQGTPALILESGELIGGYLEPAELAKYIADTKKASR